MPVCPNCGSQQPEGAAYCDECGVKLPELTPAVAAPAATLQDPSLAPMATTCPVCGGSVTAGEPFCNACGAALGQAVPTQPPPAVAPGSAAPGMIPTGTSTCSNCGAQLEPGSIFCDMCGAQVGAASPPAPSTGAQPGYQPSPPGAQPGYAPPVSQPVYPAVAAVQGRLVVQGTNAVLSFPPGKAEILVGREDPVSGVFPEVDLTDHGGDEAGVSRQHARIFIQGTQVFIEDLNSTNYTYVNQQRVMPGQPQPLNSGDEVRFGRMKLSYYA
jgi:hypothetical protein